MKHIKFNANHNIKVRLKDKGIEHIVNQHNESMPFNYHTSFKEYKSKADEFGYHSFQFWCFLDYFGNLGLRSGDYFDIDIVFEFKDFEPFEFKDKISMEEFFNKLKNMHGVTRLDLRGSNIDPAKHLYVTVSKMYCTSNEVEEVQKMLHTQKWFQWTFYLVK